MELALEVGERTGCDCIPGRLKYVDCRLHILDALRGLQLLEKPLVLLLNSIHLV